MNSENQSVVAVVVTFNRPQMLCDCLESLLRQTHPVTHILIVDNGSTPSADEQLHKAGLLQNPKIEVLRLDKNLGGSGGFAAGIKHVINQSYKWCWLTDDDVFVEEQCLEALLKFGDASVLMPARISNPFHNYHLPAVRFDFRTRFGRFQQRRKLFAFEPDSLQHDSSSYEVEDLCFEGVMMRCDVIRRAGLPRADFFITYDDYEYGCRLRYKLGEKILFVPSARIQRRAPAKETVLTFRISNGGLPNWRVYYATRNMFLLHRLYGENRVVKISPVLNESFKLAVRFCTGQLGAARAAFWGIADGVRMKTPLRFLP